MKCKERICANGCASCAGTAMGNSIPPKADPCFQAGHILKMLIQPNEIGREWGVT